MDKKKILIFILIEVVILSAFIGIAYMLFGNNDAKSKEEQEYGTKESEETLEDGTKIKTVTSKEKGDAGEIIDKNIVTTIKTNGTTTIETTLTVNYKDESKKEEYSLETKNEDGSAEIRASSYYSAVDGTVEQAEETTIKKADGSFETIRNVYAADTENNTTITETNIKGDSNGNETKTEKVTVMDMEGNIISETEN